MDLLHLHHSHLKKGIVYILIGWLFFSSLYAISKGIGNQTTISTMLFFRSLVGLLATIPWMIKHFPKSLEIHNKKAVVIRSVAGLLNLFLIFLAIQKISIVNTTLLSNSAPFFVPLLLWCAMKVPMDHKLLPAIIIGFIGIAFILHPDRRILNLGALYGILSGICLAIVLITTRISTQSSSFYSFLFYFFLIAFVLTTPFAILNWKIENGWTLLGLVGIGLASLFGQYFLFYGMKFGKTQQLAPFTYSVVVFSGIYEWIFWKEIPHPLAYIGIALIFAAGIWILHASKPPKSI